MSIFSDESRLLIENWEAVEDIFNAKQRMEKELTTFLYSIEDDLVKATWWQNNWEFNKQSPFEIYISKRDWISEGSHLIWIGVENFKPEYLFGIESSASLFVWVSSKRYDLINNLREEIVTKENDYIGVIASKNTSQYIVRHQIKNFLPEEIDDFENITKNQVINFVQYYANLLDSYNDRIMEYL